MQQYLDWMKGQSRLIRILLCIWIADITWAVYRILKAISEKNTLHLILGIIWVIAGGTVAWILDLIWMIAFDRIFWFKDEDGKVVEEKKEEK